MRTLRNTMLTGIIVLAVGIFTGCSPKDDLSIAKKGYLELDKKITVGQALDGYKYFGKKEWQAVKTPQGARLVILKTDMNPQFIKEINEVCGKADPQQKKIESQKWSIQLTVSEDEKVHISGTQTLSIFADKTQKAGSLNEPLMLSVYKNELAAVCK
ncbi:MAG: hypothetical protein A2075_06120 [Geobacteraceae bacterium GWC2_58_44]|nr:MAG: hypothetical protein A2075_06120 [Geobacteraceae bacterium GWC2_58_44]HBG05739.1 hypothetical protein [Geobacter sp.]